MCLPDAACNADAPDAQYRIEYDIDTVHCHIFGKNAYPQSHAQPCQQCDIGVTFRFFHSPESAEDADQSDDEEQIRDIVHRAESHHGVGHALVPGAPGGGKGPYDILPQLFPGEVSEQNIITAVTGQERRDRKKRCLDSGLSQQGKQHR